MLWFTYGSCDGQATTLGSLRLADSRVTLGLGSARDVASGANLPNRIVTGDGFSVRLLDVSAGAATAPPQLAAESGYQSNDLIVTPDGSEIIATGRGDLCHFMGYSTTDLIKSTVYGCSARPSAVAARSDGLVAVGDALIYGSTDVLLYWKGTSSVWRTYDLSNDEVVPGGLQFGSRDLYVVLLSLIHI